MYDLHTHSNFSDGTLPPEKLIREAKEAGLTLLALADHDSVAGIPRAAAEAKRLGLPFLAATELEADFSAQLHILGLGVDTEGKKLTELIRMHSLRREERNQKLLKKLEDGGMSIYDYLPETSGELNKSHFARAMVAAGYASTVSEAFDRYLKSGRPFHVRQEYPTMPEVMEAIIDAGGLPVLAHPMKMICDHRELVADMAEHGLWGIEAFYSTATEEQTEYFLELARDFGLRPTCGSDFHGPHRPEAQLGCAWQNTQELMVTEFLLKRIFGITSDNPIGRVRRPSRVRRRLTIGEFQDAAERVVSELPEELFTGLNGGISISEREKLHAKSDPARPLFVLGEYSHGYTEGAYITLYFGSFRRTRPQLTGSALEEEVRRVILHELRHHLETRAGEHELEDEDEASLAEYLGEE